MCSLHKVLLVLLEVLVRFEFAVEGEEDVQRFNQISVRNGRVHRYIHDAADHFGIVLQAQIQLFSWQLQLRQHFLDLLRPNLCARQLAIVLGLTINHYLRKTAPVTPTLSFFFDSELPPSQKRLAAEPEASSSEDAAA